MRIAYNPRHSTAYIRLQEKQTGVEAIRISGDLVVDIAPDGTVYGIELLNANEQLRGDEAGKLLLVNEDTHEEAELQLAVG